MSSVSVFKAVLWVSPRGSRIRIYRLCNGRFTFITTYQQPNQPMALLPDSILTLLRVKQRLGEFEPEVIYYPDGKVLTTPA